MRPMSWKVGNQENHTISSGTGPLLEISWGGAGRGGRGEGVRRSIGSIRAAACKPEIVWANSPQQDRCQEPALRGVLFVFPYWSTCSSAGRQVTKCGHHEVHVVCTPCGQCNRTTAETGKNRWTGMALSFASLGRWMGVGRGQGYCIVQWVPISETIDHAVGL